MATTTKLVLGLIVLYVVADVLLKLALRFEPWLAVGLVPVGWLFVRQTTTLYRERRRRRWQPLRGSTRTSAFALITVALLLANAFP